MDLKPFLKNKWLLVIGAVGVLCLLLGTLWKGPPKSLTTVAPVTNSPLSNQGTSLTMQSSVSRDPSFLYQDMYDKQLTQILGQMQGIHAVNVMVTLDASESVQLADNTRTSQTTQASNQKTDSSSTTSDTTVVTLRDQNGNEIPYVVKRLTPHVRGVLVTVNADDFAIAREEIIDAITNVLDVPAYKISVEPQKSKS